MIMEPAAATFSTHRLNHISDILTCNAYKRGNYTWKIRYDILHIAVLVELELETERKIKNKNQRIDWLSFGQST